MRKRTIDLQFEKPLLDVVSYGRAHRPLTQDQRTLVARTVRRVPEVVVKVSGGARTLGGVQAHLAYIGRDGVLGVELDDGTRLAGEDFQKAIVLDWDLDMDVHGQPNARSVRGRREPSKLVHNIIFSMPPGTPPDKLVKAVRGLIANEFALKHRYAFTLHTDEPHPHVHLVVRAVSERGQRLNIRKATLRHWRQLFATHLREQGVAANATERAVRGQSRIARSDGIFRATQRNALMHGGRRHRQLADKPKEMVAQKVSGRAVLDRTRAEVFAGWRGVARLLHDAGDFALAEEVIAFARQMPAVRLRQELVSGSVSSTPRDPARESLDRTR